jgi:hypothetical protein
MRSRFIEGIKARIAMRARSKVLKGSINFNDLLKKKKS